MHVLEMLCLLVATNYYCGLLVNGQKQAADLHILDARTREYLVFFLEK